MKVYLDMCALKRPFDDQRQGRILIETTCRDAHPGSGDHWDADALQFHGVDS